MKNLIITFILGWFLTFSASAQDKNLYNSPDVSVTTEVLHCGELSYANFIFINKTSSTITLTYTLEMKFAGELGYTADTEHGTYVVIINPNGTVTGACGSYDYLLYLGKTEGIIYIVDYKITNVLTN